MPALAGRAPTTLERVAHFSRLPWVDTAKGFGIILVVFGHVLRGLANNNILTWTPITHFVDAWIYTFHMPLFFFLSGLFLFRSTQKPWEDFAFDKIRTIAYPCFVWSVITIIIKSALGTTVTHPYALADMPLIFYSPIDQFWFLYALFVLLIVVSGFLKLGASPWAIFGLAFLIYPGLLPIPSGGVLIEARMEAIYLAIGLIVGVTRDVRTFSSAHVGSLAVCVVGGLIFSLFGGWSELPYRNVFQPVLAVSGIGAVVALALLINKLNVDASIRFLGRHSLEIYLAHPLGSASVRITLVKFAHVSDPASHLILGMLAGLFVPIALVVFFDQIGFRFGFSLPRPKQYGYSI
jgi:fucose 4-O-acetylase-like acetyltransferase